MNKFRTVFFLLVLALIVSLSGCSSQPLVVLPTIQCTDIECAYTVENKERKEITFNVSIGIETQGAPIGEIVRYKDTQAEMHEEYYRAMFTISHSTITLGAGEVQRFKVTIPQVFRDTPGQHLMIAYVRTPEPHLLSANHGNYYAYDTIAYSKSELPLQVSMSCDNHDNRIRVTVTNSSNTDHTFGLYLDENLETSQTSFIVKAQDTFTFTSDPIPPEVSLIMAGVDGHGANSWPQTEDDLYTMRGYCVPPTAK